MLNFNCHLELRNCPEKLKICCQFCRLNYSPCEGKCSGCWNEQVEENPNVNRRLAAGLCGLSP